AMKPAEFLLAGGLACAALGAGLCLFVMIGLLGLGCLLLAIILLLSAGVLARSVEDIPGWQIGASLVCYVVGVLLLIGTAGGACSMAFSVAWRDRHPDHPAVLNGDVVAPSNLHWGLTGLSTLAPALIVG